jgi:hypothetical protein
MGLTLCICLDIFLKVFLLPFRLRATLGRQCGPDTYWPLSAGGLTTPPASSLAYRHHSVASLGHTLIITISKTTATEGDPFTITYQNEAADPAGNMTFWLGHADGAGGYFLFSDAVPPAKNATTFSVDLNYQAGDGCVDHIAQFPMPKSPR